MPQKKMYQSLSFVVKKKHLVGGAYILYHFSIIHSPSFKKQIKKLSDQSSFWKDI